jgi:ADP-ribosylglycohydrolase
MNMKSTINQGKHLYGAIIGDIAGSVYEFSKQKSYDFELFPRGCNITDDSILTVATAYAILNTGTAASESNFAVAYYDFAKQYPHPMGGYGSSFSKWVNDATMRPYNSLGNGCAMRVSPCAYASAFLDRCIALATRSSASTHNHWQGIRAAQCITTAIYLLNHGSSVAVVRDYLDRQFCYEKVTFYVRHPDLFEAYKNDYEYTEHAEPTVIGALICALTATSYEDAIRRAISLGGDADTLAAIAGSIAEARFEIPEEMIKIADSLLPDHLKDIIKAYNVKI